MSLAFMGVFKISNVWFFFSFPFIQIVSCSTSFVLSGSGLAFIVLLHVAVLLCGYYFLCWLLRGIGLDNRWTGYLDGLLVFFLSRGYLNGGPCFPSLWLN